MSKKTEQAVVEAVARAMLTHSEIENRDDGIVPHLRICKGPAPCYPDKPCSCTENLYGLAKVAIDAAYAKPKKVKR